MANRDVIFGLSLLFIFAGVIIEQSSALTCIDEDGDPVDWYIVYKLPKYSAESGYLYNGTGYLYLDVNTPNFTLSKNNVNSSSSELTLFFFSISTMEHSCATVEVYNQLAIMRYICYDRS